MYMGTSRKTLRVLFVSCGPCWAGVGGRQGRLWNPLVNLSLQMSAVGDSAAVMGKPTSGGYITVQGQDGN